MKKYYHEHEKAYKELRKGGFIGWGKANSKDDLGDAKTNHFLNEFIKSYPTEHRENVNMLDLGCGSGTTARIFATAGFTVTGVDISETAIDMANELLKDEPFQIDFKIADVLNLSALNMSFDLIYDSHLLHCIVLQEDRLDTLRSVYSTLSDDGTFILDTMIYSDSLDIDKLQGERLRFDEQYILWHRVKEPSLSGVQRFNDELWCPQRRLYPAEKIISEVEACGFVISETVLEQSDSGDPDMLRLILTK